MCREKQTYNELAEKLIIELKDKLDLEDVLERSTRVDEGVLASAGGMSVGDIQSDAVQALVALGYGSTESMKAVKKAGDAYTTVEELLKAALKMMF